MGITVSARPSAARYSGQSGRAACPDPSAGLTSRAARLPVRPSQAPLPGDYFQLSAAELDLRLTRARAVLGRSVVILGHHYQRDEIVKCADFQGDSFKLSRQAAQCREARFIVFCGVHFMAESADILSGPEQQVILPNLEAGCSMADMANLDDVQACWAEVDKACGPGTVPVTYVNSAADVKAFCGARGGAVCTSANAAAVLRWALERDERVLFLPDEHLGRNTARQLGLDPAAVALWDPAAPLGGNALADLRRARLIVWKGYCSVHMRFTIAQIEAARVRFPGIKTIVHPECRSEVVLAADAVGSTEWISKTIGEAPAGSQWAVGTEVNLVGRLARKHVDKRILCLDPVVCPCSTMYRIQPAYLLWVLERLVAGEVVNRVVVPEEVARWARVALDRMLAIA
ncbi:MAG: quinolinate synthase NadA [Chloroflexota bacterium]